MQRIEVDRDEFEAIREELTDIVDTSSRHVTIVEGQHEAHGHVILIRQDGRFFIDADDASRIEAKGEAAPPTQYEPDQEGGEFF